MQQLTLMIQMTPKQNSHLVRNYISKYISSEEEITTIIKSTSQAFHTSSITYNRCLRYEFFKVINYYEARASIVKSCSCQTHISYIFFRICLLYQHCHVHIGIAKSVHHNVIVTFQCIIVWLSITFQFIIVWLSHFSSQTLQKNLDPRNNNFISSFFFFLF